MEFLEVLDAVFDEFFIAVFGVVGFEFVLGAFEECGVGLEFLGDGVDDDAFENFAEPVVGFVVVFAVAFDPDLSHRAPLFELSDAHGCGAFADAKAFLQVVEVAGLGAEIEVRVDLPDDASDPEGLRGVADVFDEASDGGGEFLGGGH